MSRSGSTPRRRAVLAALFLATIGLGAFSLRESFQPPRRLWVLASKGYIVGGLPGLWHTNMPWRIARSPGGAQVVGWRATTFDMVEEPWESRRKTARTPAAWHVSRLDLVMDGDDAPRFWTAIRERLGMNAESSWAYVPTGEAAEIDGTTWREVRRE